MEVERYLKAEKFSEAASIFKDAFSSKLKGILETDKQIEQVVLQSLNNKEVLIVCSKDNRVVGVAAYQYDNKISIDISLKVLIKRIPRGSASGFIGKDYIC